ncbi:MAG: 2-phosphosulfolactate phosphatase [Acidimicrobiaceae bacterium]
MSEVRFLPRWELVGVRGAVVVVDVLRAFTTAAYALAAGAREIWLVDSIDEAFAFKAARPGSIAMGEQGGRRPDGFELSNSPVQVAEHDLSGKVVVQCTGAGTRGVVAAADADRLWAASLVCASATAAAVDAAGLGPPTYVITGRFPDQPAHRADDDVETARLIERARVGEPLDVAATAARIASSREWEITQAVGAGHFHPDDLTLATAVDRFDFAMAVERVDGGLRIRP